MGRHDAAVVRLHCPIVCAPIEQYSDRFWAGSEEGSQQRFQEMWQEQKKAATYKTEQLDSQVPCATILSSRMQIAACGRDISMAKSRLNEVDGRSPIER